MAHGEEGLPPGVSIDLARPAWNEFWRTVHGPPEPIVSAVLASGSKRETEEFRGVVYLVTIEAEVGNWGWRLVGHRTRDRSLLEVVAIQSLGPI